MAPLAGLALMGPQLQDGLHGSEGTSGTAVGSPENGPHWPHCHLTVMEGGTDLSESP